MIEPVQNGRWHLFGSEVSKSVIVFIAQIVIIYVIVITSIVNLSLEYGDAKLWIALLSSNIGYLLPNPKLKGK